MTRSGLGSRLAPVVLLAGIPISWEIASSFALGSEAVPRPSAIIQAAFEMARSGELLQDAAASVRRALVGYAAGSTAGIVLGLFVGRFRWVHRSIGALLHVLRSVPAVAIVPVAITWWGLGESSKYFLVFWGVFFPVWISAVVGGRATEQQLIWAARSLGASRVRVLTAVVLPSSLGPIFGGMRAGISLAFICLVAAEMAGASSGLGHRVMVSHLVFRPDRMFAALATLTLAGALADWLFAQIVLKAAPWYIGFRSEASR